MTHRQFVAWQAWFSWEWNRPSRADHYTMQLNRDLIWIHAKKPCDLQSDQFRIPFRTVRVLPGQPNRADRDGEQHQPPEQQPIPDDERRQRQLDWNKDAWKLRALSGGGKLIRSTITREEAATLEQLSGEEAALRRREMAMQRQTSRK